MNNSLPQPRTPSEEITGLVERVTFSNEESGFAALRVKVRGQRELVTVLGSLPSVSAGGVADRKRMVNQRLRPKPSRARDVLCC
jgi:exodeoxyribonuclease V alpha subunit